MPLDHYENLHSRIKKMEDDISGINKNYEKLNIRFEEMKKEIFRINKKLETFFNNIAEFKFL